MIYRQALDDARKSLELAHEMSKAVGMAMDGGTGEFRIAKKEWYKGLPETLTWDDGRDCTGVWFTSRICIFDVPNGTWVYHFKSCDV